ncbi:macrolide family glycosyltransferase [Streptomyces hydrogenans]|uniref:macrolide family glycosyltransferase n=1 Tax=Streptomyces hydrogenans TaxID=1873719 RepID=UPI0033B0B32A
MARYAMFPSPMAGHVNPTLPMAAELIGRGHHVTYHLPEEFRAQVESVGARLSPIRLREAHGYRREPDPVARFAKVPMWLAAEAEDVLPQVLAAVDEDRPDAVLYDMTCVWGRLLARLRPGPAAMVVGSYVGNEHFSPVRTRHYAAMKDHLTAGFRETGEVIARINARHGLDVRPQDLFARDEQVVLVVMPRAFHPAGETFGEPFRFIGASLREEPEGTACPPVPHGRRLAYVSFGTVVELTDAVLAALREAFSGAGWQVLLATGEREVPATALPDHFVVRKSVPQLEVLRRADVFVTHGGTNSVMEALVHEVPMVVAARAPEHAITADQVELLGLGTRVDPDTLDAEGLRTAVETAAGDPAVRRALAEMGRAAREAGGAAAAADELEKLVVG